MARVNKSEPEHLYFHPETKVWNSDKDGATLRLTRIKVWSYSQYSENILAANDGEGHWVPVPDVARLSGLERGHYYEAYPRENDQHEPIWLLRLTRVGDEELLQFGISEGTAVKTDYELRLSEKGFSSFKKKVEAIGGVVAVCAVDMQTLEEGVERAMALSQELESLYAQAQAVRGQTDAGTVGQIDRWKEQARLLHARYDAARQALRLVVDGLNLEPGRSLDKAQAQAWLASLTDSTAFASISAILAEAVAQRALDLSGNTGAGLVAPKLAFAYEALLGLYSGTGVTVTLDAQRQTISLRTSARTVILTTTGIATGLI